MAGLLCGVGYLGWRVVASLSGTVLFLSLPVLLVEAVGSADLAARRPMTKDAMVWIASMTKPMTAAALMILVDEGRIGLDAPVAKHLPEFRELWVERERTPERLELTRPSRAITIRDALSHM
ncbi:MAG: serine hydrolase domain-containing protein, partial [Actinomycetota bacterium]